MVGIKWLPQLQGLARVPSGVHRHRQIPSEKRFTWGKPSIMLMNSNPADDPHVDYEWLEGNCEIIFISADTPLVSNVRANTQ